MWRYAWFWLAFQLFHKCFTLAELLLQAGLNQLKSVKICRNKSPRERWCGWHTGRHSLTFPTNLKTIRKNSSCFIPTANVLSFQPSPCLHFHVEMLMCEVTAVKWVLGSLTWVKAMSLQSWRHCDQLITELNTTLVTSVWFWTGESWHFKPLAFLKPYRSVRDVLPLRIHQKQQKQSQQNVRMIVLKIIQAAPVCMNNPTAVHRSRITKVWFMFLCVCLSICKITHEPLNRFEWNSQKVINGCTSTTTLMFGVDSRWPPQLKTLAKAKKKWLKLPVLQKFS